MEIMCPVCKTTEKLVEQWSAGSLQWTAGVDTKGSVIVLKCRHAFEMIPRTEFDE